MKALDILLLAAAFSILTFNVTHGEEIINGKKAKKDTWQFMASVQLNSKHKCGGFLIDPSYVLTAAHCHEKDLSVVLGTQNINPKRNDLKRYTVEKMYIHPLYNERPRHGSDIMLLKLSEKVKLSADVKIAKIPNKGYQVKPNIKCQVAGWGKTKTQETVNDLLQVDVSTINIHICKKLWNNKVEVELPANVLCAGGYKTESGACQGDSGGPLVSKGLAVGIVSFNYHDNCNYPNVPNVYTEISAYIDWINKVIKGDA